MSASSFVLAENCVQFSYNWIMIGRIGSYSPPLLGLFLELDPFDAELRVLRPPVFARLECVGDRRPAVGPALVRHRPARPEGQLEHTDQEDAPSGDQILRRIVETAVRERLHRHGGVDEDDRHQQRRDDQPADAPVESNVAPGREFQVQAYVFQSCGRNSDLFSFEIQGERPNHTVEVHDADYLEDSQNEDQERSAEVVHQGQHPLAALQ